MDPNTGRLHTVEDELEAHRRKLIYVRRELTPEEQRRQKVGRNAPCVCGSGVKFKLCCYRSQP